MSAVAIQGPRNAVTDEQTGIRYYEWEGQKYPSVTSLRRLAGMPHGLANWQMNQVIRAALNNITTLDMLQVAEGPEAAAKHLRKQAMYERDSAANRGTAVHEAAAGGVDPTRLPFEVGQPLTQYYDFLTKADADIVLSERQVWNLTLGYGGSVDALWRLSLPRGSAPRLIVGDIKTGKGVYPEMALQLLFYSLAEFVGEDDKVDVAATRLLHSAQGLALLHLTDTSWELIEIRPTPELYEVAKSLVAFARFIHDNPTIESLVNRRFSK